MKRKKLISIVCPTHRRAKLQYRFAENVYENAYDPDRSEIIFGIDNNDEIALETAEGLKEIYGNDFIKISLVEPGENLPNISNICAKSARGPIIGNAADDVVFRSKNWDITVLKEFQKYDDKILLLWSDDGLWGGALASHYFLHRNWIKTLGHVQPTHFHADWTDHWNQRLATKLGRAKVIRDRRLLFLEHLHAEHGGMEPDETYWKVKAKREKNVEEGLHFDVNNPPEELQKMHDIEYEKLYNFIQNYKK